jgi:hypothetical protein
VAVTVKSTVFCAVTQNNLVRSSTFESNIIPSSSKNQQKQKDVFISNAAGLSPNYMAL